MCPAATIACFAPVETISTNNETLPPNRADMTGYIPFITTS